MQSVAESCEPCELNRVVVIIPALNEEVPLPLVLQALPRVGRVIVVDNGSTDDTARVASANGAHVVVERQRGYGSACLRGLAEVAALGAPEPAVIVFLDADFSDSPELLPRLVAPILADHADFVLGSRLQGPRERGAMPVQSLFGNWLACGLMQRLFGAQYTDLGPFRAIRYQALQSLQMCDANFGWTIEMQIKAVRRQLRILEIPVPYRCRIGQSKISGTIVGSLRAGWKILSVIARHGCRRPPHAAKAGPAS